MNKEFLTEEMVVIVLILGLSDKHVTDYLSFDHDSNHEKTINLIKEQKLKNQNQSLFS